MPEKKAGPCLVVGYDGSGPARAALAYALASAGSSGSIFVVIAFAPPPDWLGRPNYQQVLDEHKLRARALEESLKGSGVLDGVTHAFETIGGEPAESIAKVGGVRDADEIVVGSRGFGPVRAALGSVSHELLRIADRPVTVIPDDFLATPRGAQLRDAVPLPD
jgi:nucleotide-binding universal stress UspA family protein